MPIFSPPTNPSSPFASTSPHHVGLHVDDLDAAVSWYGEKLDLRVVGRSEVNGMTFTLLALPDDEEFRLELVHGLEPTSRSGASADLVGRMSLMGFNHLALQVDDVAAVVSELKRRDVAILMEPTDNADMQMRVAFFTDPWGNVIELLEPRVV